MKKIFSLLSILSLVVVASPVFASDHAEKNNEVKIEKESRVEQKEFHVNFEKELTKKACNATGKAVINVKEKVLNDADSGQAGNYWAFDTAKRVIKAWDLGNGTFCVTVNYEDSRYNAVGGQRSPGNTGILSGKEKGEFGGGYRGIVKGTLLTSPLWPTHGSVGTVDYKCDINGNCPGAVSWMGQYFTSGYTFDYGFWGWIYKGVKDHKWVNACGADIPGNPACIGNSGDVI